jgi:hypothetical protein
MNLNDVNWKTIIGPIVASGALLYGTITGHEVSNASINTITIDGVSFIAFCVTIWGFWKDHHKKAGVKQ